MDRRSFLALSLAVAGNGLCRSVLGQPQGQGPRGAVVIGVDRPEGLPPLGAAASGARKVEAWLRRQGFGVKPLIDDSGQVLAADVYAAIEEFVRRPTLEQLVVYFSGHGFLVGCAEYWLLSRAPANPNEAINLAESVDGARDCGIPHVVFISDACRSTADSLRSQSVHGYQIFRSREIVRDPRAEVDRFFATLPGDPALEVPVSQSTPGYQGLYTACFLDAFAHPPADLVVELDGNRVIPNRRLKPYLVTTVRKRAEESSITLRQVPDAILEAGDRAYIGRVDQQAVLASPSARRQSATTISEVARLELSRAGAFPSTPAPATSLAADIDRESTLVGFSDARNALQQAQRSWKFVKRTGIVVNGAAVKLLAMHPDHRASVLQDGHGRDPTLIEVDLADRPAASVFLGFADGSGTAVAALRDFVGTVVVADRRVVNVSYVPGENSGRWPEYQQDRDRLDGLHATVAASARFGVFRISGEAEDRTRQAAQLADSIRILKGIDPTLGIYAAYAYTDAGLIDRVRSVRQYMRGDLDADVFDVAMLAGELSKRDAGSPIVAPLCPMLSQGWSLLRARGVTLPKELEAARDNLRGALWTTFEPEGAAAVGAALRSGRFR